MASARLYVGMSSIYKEDCMEDVAVIATRAMHEGIERISIMNGVEVLTPDAEFDLLDDDL
jgi:hypothetical protein